MTDNSPKAVYLRMLDAWNDGTPETYGSTSFLDYYADDAVIEMTAMVGTPAQRGGKEVYRSGVTGGSPCSATGTLICWNSSWLETG